MKAFLTSLLAAGTAVLCTWTSPADARVADFSGKAEETATARATYVVGIIYENDQYRGRTLTITAPRRCTATTSDSEFSVDLSNYILYLDVNWNQAVTSIRTFSRCDAKLIDCNRVQTGWINNNSNLGSYGNGWNDRACRIRFS